MISDTLVINSNVNIEFSPGAVIKRAASMNLAMLKNAAFVSHIAAARTTVTIAWTAGNVATVTWTAHGKTSADYVWFQGASSTIFNNVFQVADVIDVNSFLIVLTRVPTGSPTGTITALACDTNISITGGIWDGNQVNNSDATGYDRDNWVLVGVAASHFADYRHIGFHRGITCGALADVTFRRGRAIATDADIAASLASEGHKVYGPANGVRIYDIAARTADDGMSLQVKEAPAFSWTGIPFGDIHDVQVDGARLLSRGLTAAGGFVIYNSDSETFSRIRVRNIEAHSEQGSGLIIKYGDTFTTGTVDDMEVDGAILSTATPATQYALSVAVPYRQLTLRKIAPRQGSATAGGIRTQAAGTGGLLIIDDLSFNDTAFPSSAGNFITLSGATDKVCLCNSRVTGNQTNMTLIALTATIKCLELRNNDIDQISKVVNESTGLLEVLLLIANRIKNCAIVFEPRVVTVPTKVLEHGNHFDTITTGVIRPSTGSGLVAKIYGSGNLFTSATHVAATGSATWEAYSFDVAVDPIAATGLAATTGQYLVSTQATIEGGPAVLTAAGWVALGTGAAGINTVIA